VSYLIRAILYSNYIVDITITEFDLRVVVYSLGLLEKAGFIILVLGMFLELKEGIRK
jgi:hypothetical protein